MKKATWNKLMVVFGGLIIVHGLYMMFSVDVPPEFKWLVQMLGASLLIIIGSMAIYDGLD